MLETKATITKNGGVLEIPNTNVTLMIPPDSLPEDMQHCEMHLRIIPREVLKERVTLFSLNSSIVVEILPDSLKFRQPARLTVPHCWVLQGTGERKARIYISHHETGDLLIVFSVSVTVVIISVVFRVAVFISEYMISYRDHILGSSVDLAQHHIKFHL